MPRWLGEVPDDTVVTTVRRVEEIADPAPLVSADADNGLRIGSDGGLFYSSTAPAAGSAPPPVAASGPGGGTALLAPVADPLDMVHPDYAQARMDPALFVSDNAGNEIALGSDGRLFVRSAPRRWLDAVGTWAEATGTWAEA